MHGNQHGVFFRKTLLNRHLASSNHNFCYFGDQNVETLNRRTNTTRPTNDGVDTRRAIKRGGRNPLGGASVSVSCRKKAHRMHHGIVESVDRRTASQQMGQEEQSIAIGVAFSKDGPIDWQNNESRHDASWQRCEIGDQGFRMPTMVHKCTGDETCGMHESGGR